MNSKTKKKTEKIGYTKPQRATLIVSAIVMVIYVVLAYFITNGSFWDFAGIHTILATIAILFIWLNGRAPKVMTYIAIGLSVTGAVTATAIIAYYLLILGSLANG